MSKERNTTMETQTQAENETLEDKNLKITVFFCGPKPTKEELDAFGDFALDQEHKEQGYTVEIVNTQDITHKFNDMTSDMSADLKSHAAALKEIIIPGAFFINPSPGLVEIAKLMKIEEGTGALMSCHDADGKFIRWAIVW